MVLEKNEKVHVIIRRTFEGDLRRHFVGEIIDFSGSTAKIRGNAVQLDKNKNQFIKIPEVRTTIMNLAESGYIVTFLPQHIKIEELTYTFSKDRKLCLTDGKTFNLDINEFGTNR